MKQKFIQKWSTWWMFNKNAQTLNEAFEKELEELIKDEIEKLEIQIKNQKS